MAYPLFHTSKSSGHSGSHVFSVSLIFAIYIPKFSSLFIARRQEPTCRWLKRSDPPSLAQKPSRMTKRPPPSSSNPQCPVTFQVQTSIGWKAEVSSTYLPSCLLTEKNPLSWVSSPPDLGESHPGLRRACFCPFCPYGGGTCEVVGRLALR